MYSGWRRGGTGRWHRNMTCHDMSGFMCNCLAKVYSWWRRARTGRWHRNMTCHGMSGFMCNCFSQSVLCTVGGVEVELEDGIEI